MNLKKLTTTQLVNLKKSVSREIYNRREEKVKLLEAERKYKEYVLLYAKGLTSFVSKELGYNVIHTSRKNKYTFARFVLANHLRHTMNMAWIPMGHVFNSKHHSSMMHCVSTYKDLVSTGDTEFCIIKDRVESLIKQYDAKQNK